jgi:hypothetical protein
LYTTRESDSHALFMELSRLLFDGTPDLHLANFLHMITTMAESGSSEEQTEFFILNSQKVPKLPDEESVWSLSSVPSLTKNDDSLQADFDSKTIDEKSYSKSKKKGGNNSNWPPVNWKTAPGFSYANDFKVQATTAQPSSSPRNKKDDDSEGTVMQTDDDWTIEDDSEATSMALCLSDYDNLEDQSGHPCNETDPSMPVDFDLLSDGPELGSSDFSKRDQLGIGTPCGTEATQTGRLGELVAFKYLIGKVGKKVVNWVNEGSETGLPYDIVLGEEDSKEYIEVKATKAQRKDWFSISTREWQFAVDKGESYSIAHVVLLDDNVSRVSIFKNPVKSCQVGKLHLVVMMPKQRKAMDLTL